MNKMLIAVGVIFLVCMMIGYVRGFLRIVATMAATIATIVLVSLLSPYVSNVVVKTFPLEKITKEFVVPDEAEHSREVQIETIENAQMPQVFRELLLENNNEEIYQALGVTTFSDYIGKYFEKLLADIISFLIVFVVVTIIIRTIMYMLGIVEKIPVIRGLNRIGGGLLGMGTALIIVWVMFIAITLLYDTALGATCFSDIMEDEFLKKLYDSNVLMNYITKFRA